MSMPPKPKKQPPPDDKGVIEVVITCRLDVVAGQYGYEDCKTVDDCVRVERQSIREGSTVPFDYLDSADDIKLQVRKGAP